MSRLSGPSPIVAVLLSFTVRLRGMRYPPLSTKGMLHPESKSMFHPESKSTQKCSESTAGRSSQGKHVPPPAPRSTSLLRSSFPPMADWLDLHRCTPPTSSRSPPMRCVMAYPHPSWIAHTRKSRLPQRESTHCCGLPSMAKAMKAGQRRGVERRLVHVSHSVFAQSFARGGGVVMAAESRLCCSSGVRIFV